MDHVLLVQEAHDRKQLDGQLTDVGEGGGAPDVSLVVVSVQRRGAERVKHEAVVRTVQELGLSRGESGQEKARTMARERKVINNEVGERTRVDGTRLNYCATAFYALESLSFMMEV